MTAMVSFTITQSISPHPSLAMDGFSNRPNAVGTITGDPSKSASAHLPPVPPSLVIVSCHWQTEYSWTVSWGQQEVKSGWQDLPRHLLISQCAFSLLSRKQFSSTCFYLVLDSWFPPPYVLCRSLACQPCTWNSQKVFFVELSPSTSHWYILVPETFSCDYFDAT